MTEQIRSADLLVKTALASPEILEALKNNPEEAIKSLGHDAVQSLPRVLAEPDPITNKILWIIIVSSFAAVMLGSAYVLGNGVNIPLTKDVNYVSKGENILTIFTTAVAFLAGLLSPSPVHK